jgi:alkylation response protein AidB-like acyl-CoA dehydrogenase
MDLTFTDEQRMLRETVREMCAKHCTPEHVRAVEDDPVGFRPELWQQIAQIGLCGLSIAEDVGGLGQGMLDVAIVYEEFGRALAASPHFVSAIVGAGVLAQGGNEAAAEEWLPRIARGETILSVAWFEHAGGCGPEAIRTEFDDGRLTGTKILVPFASSAERLLVLARARDGIGVYMVDPQHAEAHQIKTLASDASFLVTFAGVPADQVGDWATWDEVTTDGLIALAASCVGGAERALEMTVDYAKERVQFDRPIGSFQGIAHPIADMATEIEGSKVLTYEAAWARDRGKRAAPTLAAMAKYQAADAFKRTTKVGEQTLGGIGFTLEIDMQLYFRRAKQLEITWWNPAFLEERIAAAELDPPAPFVGVEPRYD